MTYFIIGSLYLLIFFIYLPTLMPPSFLGTTSLFSVSGNLFLFCYICSKEWPAHGYSSLICFPNFFLLLLPWILDWMLFIFLLSKAYSLWRLFKKTFFLSGIILVFESFLMSAYHVYHIHMLPKHECMCMLTYKWRRTALVLIWLISLSIMTFTDIRVVTNSKISFYLMAE